MRIDRGNAYLAAADPVPGFGVFLNPTEYSSPGYRR